MNSVNHIGRRSVSFLVRGRHSFTLCITVRWSGTSAEQVLLGADARTRMRLRAFDAAQNSVCPESPGSHGLV